MLQEPEKTTWLNKTGEEERVTMYLQKGRRPPDHLANGVEVDSENEGTFRVLSRNGCDLL